MDLHFGLVPKLFTHILPAALSLEVITDSSNVMKCQPRASLMSSLIVEPMQLGAVYSKSAKVSIYPRH